MNRFFSAAAIASAVLLGTTSSFAQIQQVGRDVTFDVASWNIEWFGSPSNGPFNDDLQLQNVKDILTGSGIELWAVQEIANTQRFAELMTELGADWAGELATNTGGQRIGYIWDQRVIRKRNSFHILESFSSEFAGRPPLQAEFEVTLPDTTMIVTLINVHMKAFGDQSSYQRRVAASGRVKAHIDFSTISTKSVIFLGDYNDEMLQSTFASSTSPYENFLSDTANYIVTTLPLEQANETTWIGSANGSNLDHIIISSELSTDYLPGSASTMSGLRSVLGYTGQTSDHLPVYASFGSSTVVDVEDEVLPPSFRIAGLYPNPASTQMRILLNLDRAAEFDLLVYDALGRQMISQTRTMTAGEHELSVPLALLSPGTYFARVANASGHNSGLGPRFRTIPFIVSR